MTGSNIISTWPDKEWLQRSVDGFYNRVVKNKATVIVVDGDVGEGKTTLAVSLADMIQGSEIDLTLQLALGGEDFQEKLLECHEKKKHVLIYDEAGDFSRKSAISKFNRDMVRTFEMYRGFKILVILCLPRFYVLDKYIFELNVIRGIIHVHSRSATRGSFTCYSMTQAMYIRDWATKLIVPQTCYKYGVPLGRGTFTNISEERSKQLDKISTDAKKKALGDIVKKRDKVTVKEIAEEFGMSERWVRDKISILKNTERVQYLKVGNQHYYDKGILERIQELE